MYPTDARTFSGLPHHQNESHDELLFICKHSAVTTNDVTDSLNGAWSYCSQRLAAPFFVSQQCLSFNFVTATKSSSKSANIYFCTTVHIFQSLISVNGLFSFYIQEFNYRTLSNTNINVGHFADDCSAATY
ncbi:hypothetical protein Trydic_g910 [Trypoxylus dichotomus]